MSRPASYREQKACANCKHRTRIFAEEYDEFLYFCGLEKSSTRETQQEINWIKYPTLGICDEWEGEEGDGDE